MGKEIVLVGPVSPYRGGIAQYNTALLRELTKSTDAGGAGVSFSRQYPKWLYPGESDLDPGMPGHREPCVEYSIDSMNPLTWLQAARSIIKRRPAMVAFHWWTFFFAPCFLSIALLLKRQRLPVVLICHNLVDHERNPLKSLASKAMLLIADGFVVHSREHEQILAASYPDRPLARYAIPTYENFPQSKGSLSKRGRLELLFFGFIRPYKGLDILIDALAQLQDDEVYLTVVGEPWSDPEEIAQMASGAPNIELHLRYCNDEQVAEFFARSDVLILPYRSATGSAVASIASFYDKPVLASRVGGLPDVISEGTTGILVPPNDTDALRDAILLLDRAQTSRMSANVREASRDKTWASAVARIHELSATLQRKTGAGAASIQSKFPG